MNLVLLIYLADVVSGLTWLVTIVGFFGAAIILANGASGTDGPHEVKRKTWVMTLVFVLIGATGILIPSRESVYMMAGVYYGQELVKSPKISELGEKAYKLLEKKLDDALLINNHRQGARK